MSLNTNLHIGLRGPRTSAIEEENKKRKEIAFELLVSLCMNNYKLLYFL